MMRKGYIQELIEGLARVLERLNGLKTGEAAPEDRLLLIRQGARSLTGLDLEHLMVLPDDLFFSLFTFDGRLDAARAVVIGSLLLEEARALEQGDAVREENLARYRRSYKLLMMAISGEETLRTREIMTRLVEAKSKAGT